MLQLVPQPVPLIDDLDHDNRIGYKELLDKARRLDLWVSHQQDDHDFDLIDEWEEVEELGDVVQHGVKNPVSRPMRELRIVYLFSARLCEEKQRLVGRVQEVTEDVDGDEQDAAQVDEKRVEDDVEHEAEQEVQLRRQQQQKFVCKVQ